MAIKGSSLDTARILGLMNKLKADSPLNLSDMPDDIIKSCQFIILNNEDAKRAGIESLKNSPQGKEAEAIENSLKAFSALYEQSVKSGNSDQKFIKEKGSLINHLFNDPDLYFAFFTAIDLDALDIPIELQQRIDSEVERVQNLDVSQWKLLRDNLEAESAALAASMGVGSDVFNETRGYSFQNKVLKPINSNQLQRLSQIQELITALNSQIIEQGDPVTAVQDFVEFYIQLARDNGIDLISPNGKFAVPFPTGATLQSLSLQYLGDARRWPEIVAINNLKSPYIDEEGFKKFIKGTTSGKTIELQDAENLYVNRTVMIEDNYHESVTAKIKKIEILTKNKALITLDQDVTGFSESTEAYLLSYLPGTINSNMMIYIPSDTAPTTLFEGHKLNPDYDDQNSISAIAGVDLGLTSSGDIAMNQMGDISLSYGVANLYQAARLKLLTPVGSLLNYPGYGSAVSAGFSTAEVDVKAIQEAIKMSFATDGRFGPILASRIEKSGPVLAIDLIISLPDSDTTLPISIALKV
jgi:hypothetical protein